MSETQIIPTSVELTGIESALGDVDQLTLKLAPLREQAKSIEVKDRESYTAIAAVLSEVRNLRKQGEALFQPFNLIVDRVRTFLRINLQKHANACEEVEGICKPKMKEWERAEAEASEKEQDEINRKREKHGEAPVSVAPNIPSVGGYRRSTNYGVEVQDVDALLKQWANASGKHKQYLRQFVTANGQALRDEARRLKDPARMMKLVKGIYCWKD
jgi:hypothetical protein